MSHQVIKALFTSDMALSCMLAPIGMKGNTVSYSPLDPQLLQKAFQAMQGP